MLSRGPSGIDGTSGKMQRKTEEVAGARVSSACPSTSPNSVVERVSFGSTAAGADEGRGVKRMKDRLISAGEDAHLVQEREARLAPLNASIARGVADADAGLVKSTAEVFDALESKLKAKAKAAS
jgi:antitoxin ParD1/3/4